jgi:hypothetical protein
MGRISAQANLSQADLTGTNLMGANLTEADLTEGNLMRATLIETDLHEADLSKSYVGWTVFADIDLSVAKGLEDVNHLGPSIINIDTIYRSKRKIPEVFLRGTGIPDNFIAYISSLVGKPIEFYSCFISYSTEDQEFANRLYSDLQAAGRALLVRAQTYGRWQEGS